MTSEIQPAAPFRSLSDGYDEKKSDVVDVEPVVTEVDDLERNGKTHSHYIYENVPEGIDPRLIREERVVRGLSERHIQMIALAGAIGTGLFLGSGKSIRRAGPAGTLIGYSAVGVLVMSVTMCLAELSALAPVSGAFVRQSEFFVDRALSFAIGWSTWYGSAVSLPSEWTAVAVIMTYWTDLNAGIWIAVCIVVTFATNIFFVRVFGEVELACAMLKVALIVGLVLFGLIYDLGGIHGQERLGFHYWRDPGAFGQGYQYIGTASGRFCGFWLTLINAVYAFSGVETLAIAAAETKNPRRNIPRAAKNVFIRVFGLYMVTLFVVGLVVPSNDPHLLTSTGTAASSPFVIAAQRAGVKVWPSIINAVVITSAWSSGNHAMLTGSRTLYSLSLEGMAPKTFAKISRYGVPWTAILFTGSFQLLAFMSLSKGAETAFNWLTNINSSVTLTIWIVIGLCSIRVRSAMKVQGIVPSRLPWAAPLMPYLAHITVWGSLLVLLTGGFYSFLPGNWSVADFFSSYFSIMFFVVLYFGYKIYGKTKIVPLSEVPVGQWIALADANPESEPTPKKGWKGWFARIWWD